MPAPAMTTTTAAAARPRSSKGDDQSGLRNRRDLPRRRCGRSGLPGIPAAPAPTPAVPPTAPVSIGAGAADAALVLARAMDSRAIAVLIWRVSASGIEGRSVAARTLGKLVRAASILKHSAQPARCASILAAIDAVTVTSLG